MELENCRLGGLIMNNCILILPTTLVLDGYCLDSEHLVRWEADQIYQNDSGKNLSLIHVVTDFYCETFCESVW